jgi:hypothetical protein
MQQQHLAARAKAFQQSVGTYTDPLTGRTAHMVQNQKGDWKELTFDDHHAREERMDGGPTGGQ